MPERGHGPAERVTVNLTARSSRALSRTVELTGERKTDAINRALQLYELLEEVIEAGGSVYLRENEQAELERLRLF